MSIIETNRLVIRPPVEDDRPRFVELFTDPEFTVYSGSYDVTVAHARFDGLLTMAELVPYAKQPVIERKSGAIVGYTGVGTVNLEGVNRLEWGWRFVSDARGKGYATEAATALLTAAGQHDDGEVLCVIATDNHPSHRVAEKLGFRWWREFTWPGETTQRDLLTRSIGAGGSPLLAPALA